jgi:tetratricopeptide (TPR) repeat protein
VGNYATALAQLQASLALSRELGPEGRLGVAYSLTYLGLIGTSQNNNEQAGVLLHESLDCLRDLNYPWLEAFTRVCLGFARLNLGDHAEARSLFESSLAQFRALGDVWGISIALNAWGGMALALGDYAAARSIYEESAGLMRQEGDRWNLGLALVGLGHAVMRQNDLPQARALLSESLALWDQLGVRSGFVLSFALFAALSATHRQFARAARLLGVADALSAVGGFALYAADRIEYNRNLATARAELGETAFAAAYEEGRTMPLERAIAYALEDEPTA